MMDQVECLKSKNRGVEKSNCTEEKRHPVMSLVAATSQSSKLT